MALGSGSITVAMTSIASSLLTELLGQTAGCLLLAAGENQDLHYGTRRTP
jgi:hypothetical protein